MDGGNISIFILFVSEMILETLSMLPISSVNSADIKAKGWFAFKYAVWNAINA